MVTTTKIEDDRLMETWLIEGDDFHELMEQCLMRVRPISKDFYRDNMKDDLENLGYSWIDQHSGMGTFYAIRFAPKAKRSDMPSWMHLTPLAA